MCEYFCHGQIQNAYSSYFLEKNFRDINWECIWPVLLKKPGSPLISGGEPGFLSRFFEGFLAQKYFTY